VGLAELSDDFVASEAVQSLMRRVRIERTAESDPGYPNAAPVDYVRLRLTDGRELRTDEIHRATGHADLPLGREQIAAKFAECAAAASISEGVATRLFEALQTIDRWRGTEDLPLLA
jgi:2-methylcitrate dehydratase PrpD